jgi:uncharacterized protein HemY
MGNVIAWIISEALPWILAGFGALLAIWQRDKRKAADKRVEDAVKRVAAGQIAKVNRNDVESQDDQYIVDILTGKLRK